jgi:hypothetical protein
MRRIAMLLVAFAVWPLSAAPREDVVQLSHEAYIFGYPLVIMGITAEVWLTHHKLNQFDHLREFPDDTFREIVRPNADTLYSMSWMDLGNEPVILSVPDTKGRYYIMQFMDAWTNTFAAPGTRTTGNKAGSFAIIGPRWNGHLPRDMTTLRSPTNMVWLFGRVQTNTAADYAPVHALQDQFRLTPWSAWGKSAKPAQLVTNPDRTSRTPVAEMERMDAATFFARLSSLMQRNPPARADAPLVRRLETIGIRPGRDFDFTRLPSETQKAVERGVAEAKKAISGMLAGAKTETIPAGSSARMQSGVTRSVTVTNCTTTLTVRLIFTSSIRGPARRENRTGCQRPRSHSA